MKVGVLGYQGVGKSTTFAALTGRELNASPSGKQRAVADVMDPRLDHLREVFGPRKFTRARFEIEECPVIPSADSKGRSGAIAELREPDALLLVIGTFEQARMTLDESLHDADAQLRSLQDELLLFDMEVIEQRLERIADRSRRGAGDKTLIERETAVLERLLPAVEAGTEIDEAGADRETERLLSELRLFAVKPLIPVYNVAEEELLANPDGQGTPAAKLSAPVEYEISRIEEAERGEFLAGYGLEAPASERLTRLAYEALDLISFFTVGQDEVRGWPIRRGATAVSAAGKIHSDLERGFIRAEVTPYARVQSVTNAREFKEAGAADLKGKDYVVEDGDSLNIRFSV